MTQATVTHSRADALISRIADHESNPARREAIMAGLVDALIDCDDQALAAALDALRDARGRSGHDPELAGWLDAAIACAYWGLERVPPRAAVARGTRAHDFLSVLSGSGQLGSADLRRLLEIDETQVSRTGRRLLESGLVSRRKVGRQVYWQLTPRGERALDDTPAAPSSPDPAPRGLSGAGFWREALRRGFKGAYGDQPGEPRLVDPTRERIIESTLELHTSRGIRATTWPEIAERAGVPLETVEALFPTLDDLVRSCGQHVFERLRVPAADQAPEVFAGASTEQERIHRMVETLFGAYERGGDGIAAARRERNEVPAVDESLRELDSAFDALIHEALGSHRVDDASVGAVRGLTDLEMWRALRARGATAGGAVEQASAAVERWVEARPLR